VDDIRKQVDEAIAELRCVSRHTPDDSRRLFEEAIAAFERREYRTCTDLAMEAATSLINTYGYLVSTDPWHLLFISAQRSTLEPQLGAIIEKQAGAMLRALRNNAWEATLMKVTLGEADAEEGLSLAKTAEDRCRACFYAGARLVTLGQREKGTGYLMECFLTEVRCFEYRLACAELRELLDDG